MMSVAPPKYRWRSAANFGQNTSKCSAVSSPVPQCGHTGDVIWPVNACRKLWNLIGSESVGGLRFVLDVAVYTVELLRLAHYRLISTLCAK